ncbi:MAG: DNA primase [Deltaproteobacteria bacterium]|nr:MAG: DNA primase [Deltaproteobacteria bacterium]TMB16398.1 MAG: DNA primase [Deltaproteobacteria bacterium]
MSEGRAGGLIAEEAIRRVRERASLTEVVSDVVTLRRRGRSAVGLCPFHAEKTPSFTVSEERGFFHCFGCGVHGDVFAFVMRTESLAFPEAVRRVAERFGIPVPETVGARGRTAEPLVAVNAAAAAFFQAALAGPLGAGARDYVRERGLRDETVRRFGLGYAPGAGDVLARHLRAKNFPLEDAITAGLLLRRDRAEGPGGVFDRFRDRLMFPITDPSGKVVAFGGRVLPGRPATGDPPPKYLNSPESPLFRKGQMLYGLFQAREPIRRAGRAVVVEGYLDAIACAQAGVEEVVAPLGTALTVDQLRVLRRLSEVVIACFDGDQAGRRAAARSFPALLEAGLWGRGAFLPAGEDPDTFVRAKGREALEACLAAAEPLVEAYLEELAGPRRDAVGRHAEAAKEVTRILRRVRSPFERDALARLAAERLGVREESLREEGRPELASPGREDAARAPEAAGGPEELLVELMAADPEVANRVRVENVIPDFAHPLWRRTAESLTAIVHDPAAVIDVVPPQLRDRVARRVLGEEAEEDRARAVADCIAAIRRRRQRGETRRLRDEIRAAEARGDAAASAAAVRELQRLMDPDSTQKAHKIGVDREDEPGSD